MVVTVAAEEEEEEGKEEEEEEEEGSIKRPGHVVIRPGERKRRGVTLI